MMSYFGNDKDWELFAKLLLVMSIIGVLSVIGSCSYGLYWAYENVDISVKEQSHE